MYDEMKVNMRDQQNNTEHTAFRSRNMNEWKSIMFPNKNLKQLNDTFNCL